MKGAIGVNVLNSKRSLRQFSPSPYFAIRSSKFQERSDPSKATELMMVMLRQEPKISDSKSTTLVSVT